MHNCKVEFLEETQGKEVLCADISYGSDYWDSDRKKHALLPVGFNDEAFALFLAAIDYNYDAGYGGQEVFGTIWYKDGTWSERGEYDGSEWWEYKKMPEIPDTLTSI